MASPNVGTVLVISSAVGIAVFLHGCGAGGDTTTTTTANTTTTTGTTTVGERTRAKAMSSQEAADYLNKQYIGFDENNDKSPLGVTLSMPSDANSFFGNLFCSLYFNPKFKKHTGCAAGQANCRMSAATLSHKWMLKDSGSVALFAHRIVGYVFNQTMVEQKWSRCSYLWDGASNNKYNRGCGVGASADCNSPNCAYNNICPSTHKTCTADDSEVSAGMCQSPNYNGGTHPAPPTHGGNYQCFFPGVAVNFHGQPDYTPRKDFTREMLKTKVKFADGKDGEGPNLEKYNEIVLDEELMVPDFWADPVAAMPAFIYTKTNGAIAKNEAAKIRDDFCSYYQCGQGNKIPLVMIDDQKKLADGEGPFVASDAEATLVV